MFRLKAIQAEKYPVVKVKKPPGRPRVVADPDAENSNSVADDSMQGNEDEEEEEEEEEEEDEEDDDDDDGEGGGDGAQSSEESEEEDVSWRILAQFGFGLENFIALIRAKPESAITR